MCRLEVCMIRMYVCPFNGGRPSLQTAVSCPFMSDVYGEPVLGTPVIKMLIFSEQTNLVGHWLSQKSKIKCSCIGVGESVAEPVYKVFVMPAAITPIANDKMWLMCCTCSQCVHACIKWIILTKFSIFRTSDVATSQLWFDQVGHLFLIPIFYDEPNLNIMRI